MKQILTLFAFVGLAGHVSAAVSTIPTTGWNYDMVLNNPAPYNTVTGTMDGGFNQAENWTWLAAGDYANPDGVVTTMPGLIPGSHMSLTGNGSFTFQPFDQNNVVGLDANESGTLTLLEPAAYNAIALYGASGSGAKTAAVTLTFTDSTTTTLNVASGTGIGTDWFNTSADRAFIAGARGSNKSEEGFTRLFLTTNDAIAINESYFELDPVYHDKLLQSVTIQNTGGNRMTVFAISGQAVPEPSITLLGGLSLLGLLRRRRG